ncbi:uncharacterized protein LOC117780745 [Drosophila innubila]|uniref:uncharacterized protein LOC117780745 n=1 Tax=Drosophila innubila TaxID=198719 RepID=UPI00148C057E|nr:uncharacterized protein LOC117780745 [Drosophila innubila]
MKFVIVLFCLVAYVAAECNPNGNGEPNCTGIVGPQSYRNFWDPTKYFVCENGKISTVQCPINTGYMSEGGCVSWITWVWTPPCPESDA